jgi:TRAP-type C4-dicarboxylate transport system permease small subunit
MSTTPTGPSPDLPEPDRPVNAAAGRPEDPRHDQVGEPVRWRPVMRVLGTVRRALDRVLAVVCVVAFTALVVIVAWQVFTREILDDSATWTEESARYMFVGLALFSAAYVFSERGHIAVEILVERLPERGQQAMAVIIELTVIAFTMLVFIIGGIRIAENAWAQNLSTLPITVGQAYLALPVAGTLIIFYSVYHILGVLSGAERPTPEFDENAEAI